MINKRKCSLKYFLGALALTFFCVGGPNSRLLVRAQGTETRTGIEAETEIEAEVETEAETKAEAETVIYESPVFTDGGETFLPRERLERGGKEYQLVSTKIEPAVKEGTKTYASAVVPYVLEGRQEPPEKAVVTLIDDATGGEYERELPMLEAAEKDSFWDSEFSFSVTVSGYDSDGFLLGETEIPAGSDLVLYGKELLKYLGLPEDCYKVEAVEWDGECYEQDGILCRNAIASGVKRMRNVEVKYGGQVQTPEVQGRKYVGIYEEITAVTEEKETQEEQKEEEQADIYEIKNSAHELSQEEGFFRKALHWMEKHLTVIVFGAEFFLASFLAGVLFWLLYRENKRKRQIS